MTDWHVYLVRCADGSLYCGVSTDVEKRVVTHNLSKRGAKYTRSRRPVTLVWTKKVGTKSNALKEECRIKKMRKSDKEKMIANFSNDDRSLSARTN